MANEKMYVCNINLSDRYSEMIMAGTPFIEEILIKHTFDTLLTQKHIQLYTGHISVTSPAKGKELASIPRTTPDAALHPPKVTSEERTRKLKNAALLKRKNAEKKARENADKEKGKAAEATKAVKEEEEAQAKLKEAEALTPPTPAPVKTESTVQQIWICDPEQIKDRSMVDLLAAHRTQCVEYNLPVEVFTDKALLIAKLCSEFQK